LRELLCAANRRYLAFLSELADPTAGVQQVERLAAPVRHEERTYRRFNLVSAEDLALFLALTRSEWQISGFRNATLRRVLPDRSGPQISRLLKLLHLHGLIKKVSWATAWRIVINLGADDPAPRPQPRSNAADGSPLCKVFLPNTV